MLTNVQRYGERHLFAFISLVGTIAVLWGMLLPGYILTLDLVWVPHLPLVWATDSFNNAYPLFAFFHYLSFVVPGWVGEKVMLVALFFLIFYLPMRCLPFIESRFARMFAGLLYALNPFVYTRMLAGQWLVLAGYALLPLLLFSLERFTSRWSKRAAVELGLVLALIGVVSTHFVYLALLVVTLRLTVHVAAQLRHTFQTKMVTVPIKTGEMCSSIFMIAVAFLLLSSFWIVPAMLRHAPVESRFDTTHFEAFAAAPNGDVPVMLAVLTLGGFWGESQPWSLYFRWPQAEPLFWVAAAAVGILVCVGVYAALRRRLYIETFFLILLGLLAYVTALGAAQTPLRAFNMFLYAHMPMWEGLRDSQKIVGLLALVYIVSAGLGVDLVVRSVRSKARLAVVTCMLVLIPALFGMYEWRGFHRQLQPVWYPDGWAEAKAITDTLPPGEKVLVLPWHGYLSLPFNNQLIVSNPAPAYFGETRVVAGKSIDLGAVHDEEVDATYRALDAVLSSETAPSSKTLSTLLHDDHIRHVLILANGGTQSGSVNWTDLLGQGDAVDNREGEIGGKSGKIWVLGTVILKEIDLSD